MLRGSDRRLLQNFEEREVFSREDLLSFYRLYEPELKKGTLAWRIHDLKNRNIISTVKRGWYVICDRREYVPECSPDVLDLNKGISNHFQDNNYCIWETSWIREFSQHQFSKQIIIIEIEKGLEQNLFFFLKDNFSNDIFLNPDQKEIDIYIAESMNPIVVKRLITRSPLTKMSVEGQEVLIPQLEKLLVDIFSDTKLLYFYQGREIHFIFENALQAYAINYTRLMSYARRRDKGKELKEYLNQNMEHVLITPIP